MRGTRFVEGNVATPPDKLCYFNIFVDLRLAPKVRATLPQGGLQIKCAAGLDGENPFKPTTPTNNGRPR